MRFPWQAIICAGLYPNVAATEQGIAEAVLSNLKQPTSLSRKGPAWYDGRRAVYIHQSSINSDLKSPQYPFLVFLEKVCTAVFKFYNGYIHIRYAKSYTSFMKVTFTLENCCVDLI